MNYKSLINKFLLLGTFLLGTLSLGAQDAAQLDAGKAIFRANCAACHAGDMKSKLTGPALGGSSERWADYGGEEALYSWIRNSQAMIQEGNNERANQLWAEWGPTVMTSFLQLTDEDLANVLAYIDYVYVSGPWPPPAPTEGGEAGVQVAERDNTPLFIGLAVLLALLAVVLARVASNLNYMIKVRETGELVARPTLWETLTSRGVVSFVVFALVVAGGYFTVNNAIQLGRQQGYAPEQPIQFSHATHAGIHQIDCQY
jgi:mono/diheme cytochrome c family protein